jgi:hypothetical protein
MKNATLLILLAWFAPLRAASVIQVHWNEICRTTSGNLLEITTSTGDRVEGYCTAVGVDEISISTQDNKDMRVVKIARTALSRIVMRSPSKGHHLRALGRGMRENLKQGVDSLFSEMAPVGLVHVPGTLAWGAIAAPFCLLGDLGDKLSGAAEPKEIRIIAQAAPAVK